jgi:hypothetical protein
MPAIREALTRRTAEPDDTELAEKLPVGYRDKASPNWIEPDLRQAVADYPPDRWRKVRRSLYAGAPVARGRHVIDPTESEADLDTVTLWCVIDDIRRQQSIDAGQAERRAHEARVYSCPACGAVAPPAPFGAGIRRRPLPDGTSSMLCERCHAVADQLTLERLAAEPVNGSTRGQAVARYLEAQR